MNGIVKGTTLPADVLSRLRPHERAAFSDYAQSNEGSEDSMARRLALAYQAIEDGLGQFPASSGYLRNFLTALFQAVDLPDRTNEVLSNE